MRRLVAGLGSAPAAEVAAGEVPADWYVSPQRFSAERAAVFARQPIIVAAEHELREPGTCLPVEVAGVPLLVVRGRDGMVKAFRNACRHRSTELLRGDAPCLKKAIVCPYHGWTYDLDGRLVHVPHQAAFDGKQADRDRLSSAHVAVRHGFVWAALEPFDLSEHLGGIEGDLASLDAARLSFYRRSSREVSGNWKLIIDAFLDGYHIRHLHRDTLHRFFLDGRFEAERAGRHIRAVTARRSILELPPEAIDSIDLRQVVTPSYLVFPHTVLVLHPDYLSVLWASPLGPDRTRFVHLMLIAEAPASEADDAHWAKSFSLIDDGVFAREDLAAVEAMQRGIASGAGESLLFGRLEHPALWFHEALDRCLAG